MILQIWRRFVAWQCERQKKKKPTLNLKPLSYVVLKSVTYLICRNATSVWTGRSESVVYVTYDNPSLNFVLWKIIIVREWSKRLHKQKIKKKAHLNVSRHTSFPRIFTLIKESDLFRLMSDVGHVENIEWTAWCKNLDYFVFCVNIAVV